MKTYNTQQNIGKAKYVVNYHDGVSTHKDGSPFYNIVICTNKIDHARIIRNLKRLGYTNN